MYKLKVYHDRGHNAGKLKKEEFFKTRVDAEKRYNELFNYEKPWYSPTLWTKHPEKNQWVRIYGY